jgi:hypothetical protein
VKSYLAFGRNWGFKHLAEGGENGVKFGVVTLFHFSDLAAQVLVSGEHGAKLKEGAHDGDVDLHSAITMKNAGKHGDAMFSECVRKITATSAPLLV